jgi:hypothetical protein
MKKRRYDDGGLTDAMEMANNSEESQNIANEERGDTILKAMRDEAATPKPKPKTIRQTAPARPAVAAPARPALAASATELAENNRRANQEFAKNNPVSPIEKERQKKMEANQALEGSYPEALISGGAGFGIKSIAAFAKKMAERGASAKNSVLPYLKEIGYSKPALGNNQLRLGMKKGGMAKMAKSGSTKQVSSASKRADGIATKGKTRGRMC